MFKAKIRISNKLTVADVYVRYDSIKSINKYVSSRKRHKQEGYIY